MCVRTCSCWLPLVSFPLLPWKGCSLCAGNLALLRMSNNSTDGPNLLPPFLSGGDISMCPCPTSPPVSQPSRESPPALAFASLTSHPVCSCPLRPSAQGAPARGQTPCTPTETGKSPWSLKAPASTKGADPSNLEGKPALQHWPRQRLAESGDRQRHLLTSSCALGGQGCVFMMQTRGRGLWLQQQRAGLFGQPAALPLATAVPSLTPARLAARAITPCSFIHQADMVPKPGPCRDGEQISYRVNEKC